MSRGLEGENIHFQHPGDRERGGDIRGAGDGEGGTGTKFFSPVSGNSQIITSRANNS